MQKKLLETKLLQTLINQPSANQVPPNTELDFYYADFETTLLEITNSPNCLVSTIRQLNFAFVELAAIEACHTQKKYTHICA